MASVTKDLGIVSAYGYAKAGGYTGTEEEFQAIFNEFTEDAPGLLDRLDEAVDDAEAAEAAAVAANTAAQAAKTAAENAASTFTTDTTLAVSGKAADAKVTGDEITGLKTAIIQNSSDLYDVSGFEKYYGDDFSVDGTEGASNSSCLSVVRNGTFVTINGGNMNESRAQYQKVYFKLTGTPNRTNNRNTVTAWSDGIKLISGHTYRVDNEYVSGTTTLAVETPPGVSVYKLRQYATIGTSYRTEGTSMSRRFVATDDVINLVLYIPCHNVTYTQYKMKITLVDESVVGSTPISSTVGVNYSGEKLDFSNHYFTTEEYFTMPHSVSTSVQGGACYGKYYFQFTDTMDSCAIYDMEQKSLVQEITMTGVSHVHCNNANFGPDFYNASDEFPLLYISNEYIDNHNVLVYRITKTDSVYGLEQVQTITWDAPISNSVYFPNGVIDTEARKIVQLGYITNSYEASAENKLIYNTFNLPDFSTETVTLTDNEKIDSFTLPSVRAAQASFFFNGKIIQAFGGQSGDHTIRAIDLTRKCFTNILDMNNEKIPSGRNVEIESVFVYDGNLYGVTINKLIFRVLV